jgi:hypothetical protein
MKLIRFLLLSILFSIQAQSFVQLLPVRKNGKWGLINERGEQVTPFQTSPVSTKRVDDNVVLISQFGNSGIINIQGRIVCALVHDSLSVHRMRRGHLIILYKQGMQTVLRYPGRRDKIPDTIQIDTGRLYLVTKDCFVMQGQEGLTVNSFDSEISKNKFTKVEPWLDYLKIYAPSGIGLIAFDQGEFSVQLQPVYDSLVFQVTPNQMVLAYKKKSIEYYDKWLYRVNSGYGTNWALQIQDPEITQRVWFASYPLPGQGNPSHWLVQDADTVLLYSFANKKVVFRYEGKFQLWRSHLMIGKPHQWGISDLDGNNLIPCRYESIQMLDNVHFLAIDSAGLQTLFYKGKEFIVGAQKIDSYNPHFIVKNAGGYQFASTAANILSDTVYEKIFPPLESIFAFQYKQKFGLMNTKGSWVLNPDYDSLEVTRSYFRLYHKQKVTIVEVSNGVVESKDEYENFKTLKLGLVPVKYKATKKNVKYDERYSQWYFDPLLQKYGCRNEKKILVSPQYDIVNHRACLVEVGNKVGDRVLYGLYYHDYYGIPRLLVPVAQKGFRYSDVASYCVGTDTMDGCFVVSVNSRFMHRTFYEENKYMKILSVDAIEKCTRIILWDEDTQRKVYGFYTAQGKRTVIPELDEMLPVEVIPQGDLYYAYAKARIGDKWGIIYEDGRWLIQPEYSSVNTQHFNYGYALVERDTIQYQYITPSGNWLSSKSFLNASEFKDGAASVSYFDSSHIASAYMKSRVRWNMMSSSGKFLIPFEADTVGLPQQTGLVFYKQHDWGLMNTKGEIIVTPRYQEVGNFEKGIASIKAGTLYGYINTKGEEVIPPTLSSVSSFVRSGKSASASNGNLYGILDTMGRWVLKPKYAFIGPFDSLGLAVFKKKPSDNKVGVIRQNGKIAIAPKFEAVVSFSEGLAAAKLEGRWGYIDPKGNWKIEPQYKAAYKFKQGQALVRDWDTEKYWLVTINNERIKKVTDRDSIIQLSQKASKATPKKNSTVSLDATELPLPYQSDSIRIDKEGQQVVIRNKQGYSIAKGIQVTRFTDGVARLARTQGAGLVDSGGKILLYTCYDAIEPVSAEIVKVYRGDTWGYYQVKQKRWIWQVQ